MSGNALLTFREADRRSNAVLCRRARENLDVWNRPRRQLLSIGDALSHFAVEIVGASGHAHAQEASFR